MLHVANYTNSQRSQRKRNRTQTGACLPESGVVGGGDGWLAKEWEARGGDGAFVLYFMW